MRATALLVLGLLAVPVLAAALLAAIATAALQNAGAGFTPFDGLGEPAPPSPAAVADIPPTYLRLYQQAAADCPGLDWALLAAIGKQASDHGRTPSPGTTVGHHPPGAAGPMQLLPAAFADILTRHRPPPGGATPPSIDNPHDAVHAAADYLCDQHAVTDPTGALHAYNPDPTYLAAVLAGAAGYRAAPVLRRDWPPEQATVPDPTHTGGHVTPRTALLYTALTAADAIPHGATCWDPHLQNPDSDHPRGKACDVFFHPHDPADITRGWALARQLIDQQARYGVHYLIWQGLIWSTEHPTWATYHSPIYHCPDPTNLTGCHYDHIHISLY